MIYSGCEVMHWNETEDLHGQDLSSSNFGRWWEDLWPWPKHQTKEAADIKCSKNAAFRHCWEYDTSLYRSHGSFEWKCNEMQR